MTYYKTLGVADDASSDKIRRAYRRLIRAAHPDLGNEEEREVREARSAVLNEAYGVLSDPVKRAEYDRSGGKRSAPEELDDEIKDVLAAALADGLGKDAVDVLSHARKNLNGIIAGATDTCIDARRKRNKYAGRRAAFRVNEGHFNIVHELIDDTVRRLDAIIQGAERHMAVANAALEELKFYGQEITAESPPTASAHGFNISWSGR